MSFSLLLPLGLAALAALVVPILIHLIRRPEQHVIEFAALRWLDERVRPRRRLRLDELWLLLVRLVLVTALAILLARPVLDRDPRAARAWIAVAPGADLAAARAVLPQDAGEWHWLAPGFPTIDAPAPTTGVAIASLVRDVDAALAPEVGLAIVVPEMLDDLDAERLVLSRAVDWRVVAAAPDRADASAAAPPAQRALAVQHSGDAGAALRFIDAALAAWNAEQPGRYTADVQPAGTPLAPDMHWLVWFGSALPAEVEAWVRAGGRALVVAAPSADADRDTADAVVWRNAYGAALARAQALGEGRLIRLTRAFDVAAMPELLDADFPDRLRALFEDAPRPPMRAPAVAVPPRSGAMASTRPPFSLEPWLTVLIAGLFVLERALAMRRHGRP